MRTVAGKSLLFVVGALALMGTPGRADELLLMPYSCAMVEAAGKGSRENRTPVVRADRRARR